jgi:hypothetical protein
MANAHSELQQKRQTNDIKLVVMSYQISKFSTFIKIFAMP